MRTHIELFTGERTVADTRRVSLNNTNNFADRLRWDSQASQHATNRTVTARHIWIRSKVNVQHGSIGTLNENSFAVSQRRVKIEDGIFHIWTKLLSIFLVALQLSVNVDDASFEKSLVSFNN